SSTKYTVRERGVDWPLSCQRPSNWKLSPGTGVVVGLPSPCWTRMPFMEKPCSKSFRKTLIGAGSSARSSMTIAAAFAALASPAVAVHANTARSFHLEVIGRISLPPVRREGADLRPRLPNLKPGRQRELCRKNAPLLYRSGSHTVAARGHASQSVFVPP